MRFSPRLVLGPGQAAIAAFANTTSAPQPTQTGNPRLPAMVGAFQVYGCTSSSAGFPTFSNVASSPDMTLELCAASCPTRFFGTFDTDCYCGEVVDPANSNIVAPFLCDIQCPGDLREACGGRVGPLVRRQSVPLNIFLSVYIRISGQSTTVTRTVTTTMVSTSTGSGTTQAVTITTQMAPIIEFNEKKIVCFGDFCTAEFHAKDGERHRIVCHEDECHPEVHHEKDWDKLVHCKKDKCHFPECKGDECKRKIVCFDGKCAHEKCFEDECDKKFVCHGEECKFEKCHGDECHKKFICEGKECKPEPPCHDKCPEPCPPHKDHDHKDHDHKDHDHKDHDHKDHDHDHDHKDHDHDHENDHGKVASPPSQGSKPPGNKDTPPVVVAGSYRTTVTFNLLGAAAGLLFLI